MVQDVASNSAFLKYVETVAHVTLVENDCLQKVVLKYDQLAKVENLLV